MAKSFNGSDAKLIRRHFGAIVYLLALGVELALLWSCRDSGLLAAPSPGTDQLGMLDAAHELACGTLPGAEYRYSYGYTAFLALLSLMTAHKLVLMRILQAALCALIPVMIFRCAKLMRLGFEAGAIGALLWLFYAPGALITLDFLRAAPLALVFIAALYRLLRLRLGHRRKDALLLGLYCALLILGRENFAAPVLVLLAAWLVPVLRRRLGGWRTFSFFAAMLLAVMLAVMLLNGLRFGSFQPVPGNAENILDFYHGKAAASPGALALSLLERIPSQLAAWFSSYEMPNSLSVYAHAELVGFLRIFVIPYNLILGLALLGAFFERRRHPMLIATAAAALYIASMLFFTLFYRFRIPVIPLLALAGGAGVSGIVSAFLRKQWRTGSAAALLLVGFLALTHQDPDRLRTESERAAVARFLIDHGRFDEADRCFQRMHRDGLPVAPGVRLMLIRQHESGDAAGARETFAEWQKRFAEAPKNR